MVVKIMKAAGERMTSCILKQLLHLASNAKAADTALAIFPVDGSADLECYEYLVQCLCKARRFKQAHFHALQFQRQTGTELTENMLSALVIGAVMVGDASSADVLYTKTCRNGLRPSIQAFRAMAVLRASQGQSSSAMELLLKASLPGFKLLFPGLGVTKPILNSLSADLARLPRRGNSTDLTRILSALVSILRSAEETGPPSALLHVAEYIASAECMLLTRLRKLRMSNPALFKPGSDAMASLENSPLPFDFL